MSYTSKTIVEIFPNLSKEPMSAYVDGHPLPVRVDGIEGSLFAIRLIGRGKNKGKVEMVMTPKGAKPLARAKWFYKGLSDSIEVLA